MFFFLSFFFLTVLGDFISFNVFHCHENTGSFQSPYLNWKYRWVFQLLSAHPYGNFLKTTLSLTSEVIIRPSSFKHTLSPAFLPLENRDQHYSPPNLIEQKHGNNIWLSLLCKSHGPLKHCALLIHFLSIAMPLR